MPPIRRASVLFLVVLLAPLLAPRRLAAQELGENALREIRAVLMEKQARTPSERKLDTSLLYAHRQSRGKAMVPGFRPLPRVAARAKVDFQGMVVVEIKTDATDAVVRRVDRIGGRVLSSYPAYGAVKARVSIGRIDELAALPEVRFVGPQEGFLANGSVTSEGDTAHAAAATRTALGINGTGVKIGVISNGVDSLAARQASGELPPTCSGGGGACVTAAVPAQPGCGDEGTAMLEIVHDLAPGAQLFFATALDPASATCAGSIAAFAANIQALRTTHSCDIIIDDITYFNEGAFQDGPIAQAVNTVSGQGVLYFSSAGNSGNKNDGQSGTWEGDYVNSGTTIAAIPPDWTGKQIHSFNGLTGGSAANSNPLTVNAPFAISLKWSDPLGASTNDYDLFLFDGALANIFDISAGFQTGTQDPFEIMGQGFTGERIVIVNYADVSGTNPALPRAFHLDTNRGRLSISTAGNTHGHNAGANTISVAATDVAPAGTGPFIGGPTNPVETYSSDGPRRIFFNPNGTAITPGNLLFSTNGGLLLQKPDITAADCVVTTTPGFIPFCGTSAAAPHAGAIAALLKSLSSNPTTAQVKAALLGTALDIEVGGIDRDSGTGIVMANTAANLLFARDFFTVNPCRVFDTRQVTGPTSGAPLTCGVDYTFTMTGGTCGVPATAQSVSLNATVTSTTNAGNLRLFPGGTAAPTVSALNWSAGQTRGNNAIILLSPSGQMRARCATAGTTHLIVDVNGYFE